MKGKIIFAICIVLLLVVIVLAQQNPSYRSFNTNHFETNASPWKIALRTNLTITNLTLVSNAFFQGTFFATNIATFGSNVSFSGNVFVSNNVVFQGTPLDPLALWLPSVNFVLWYDPFASSVFAGGKLGRLGWTQVSSGNGGLGVTNSFAQNHFGTMELLTRNDAANSIQIVHLSNALAGQPSVPPLGAITGWTNRFIWRITGSTNSFRAYIHLAGQNTYTAVPIGSGIGIMINSTNTDQVQGFCVHSSVQTRTNLGTFALNTWMTNAFWSRIPGVMSFSMNDGPECAISNNIPTSALTPNIVVMTTAVGTAATLELDEWMTLFNIVP